MKKTIFILVPFVILFLALFIYVSNNLEFVIKKPSKTVKQKEQKITVKSQEETSPTSSPSPKASPQAKDSIDLVEYKNAEMGFSLMHPNYLKPVTLQDGYISFYLKGPTQKADTEFFDGISLSLLSMPAEGKSLIEIAEKERTTILDIYGDEVSAIDELPVDGREGYIFNDNFAQYIFVKQNDDKYLQVLNMTKDPGDLGYKQIAFDMIKSLKVE